jgi:hypothetical protein
MYKIPENCKGHISRIFKDSHYEVDTIYPLNTIKIHNIEIAMYISSKGIVIKTIGYGKTNVYLHINDFIRNHQFPKDVD